MSPQDAMRNSARPSFHWLLSTCCLLLGLLAIPLTAQADAAAFVLADQSEANPALGRYLDVLVDPTGRLDLVQVTSTPLAERFVHIDSDVPAFGFTRDVYWLRLRVRNPERKVRAWLLEMAYPHIDLTELYVPRSDGSFEVRRAGDALPFAKRELPYRNAVFSLEQPAGVEQTYYLRVQTTGSMVLPLRAWTPRGFFEHQGRENAAVWMFNGLTLVMSFYNLFLFLFIRQREYLLYALYVFSMGAMNFTLYGHTFQYILPENPALAGKMMPATIALLLGCVVLFADACLNLREVLPGRSRLIVPFYLPCAALLAVGSFFLSYATALRLTALLGFGLVLVGPVLVYMVARAGSRPAKIFLAAFACLIVGTFFHYMELLGVVPSSVPTRWGIQIGAAAEAVLLSVALAERINGLRADLSRVNGKLTEHVADLKLALSRAEQATRAKSEFLATMSHELRTPLNAIINIPQSIAERFRPVRAVECNSCKSTFTLEPEESVADGASCPECQAHAALKPLELTEFIGNGSETLEHLSIVERAGKHLLQMVNGVLDFSKMEAGRVELRLAQVSVAALLKDAMDTLAPLSARADIRLSVLAIDPATQLRADALRLKQVLINLVGNAIKFSGPSSTVEIGVVREGKHLVLHVRDQGIGIAPQDLARIFRTFEQVDQGDTRKYGGTGLGLSISRSLVELHGGEIWAESELGKGSTFFVRLPIDGPRTEARAANTNASEASVSAGATARNVRS